MVAVHVRARMHSSVLQCSDSVREQHSHMVSQPEMEKKGTHLRISCGKSRAVVAEEATIARLFYCEDAIVHDWPQSEGRLPASQERALLVGLVYSAVSCSRLSGPAQELEIGDVGSLRLQSCVARAVVESANSSLDAQMGTRRWCI